MVKPVSADHLFPRFHVRPPLGYLNDPNGPLLLDGTFHLYYQYRHSTDHAAPVVWGHATSADLAHWVHQRPAIVPHPVLGDRDGCWSGNTVVDDAGRVRAFYSGRRNGHPYQSVLCAVSGDGGASFGDPRQVVDDPDPSEGIITFRDPFVWRDQDRWLMVVGAGDASLIASARLYGSDDLDRWQHLGVLAAQRRTVDAEQDTGEMWECPQVIQLAGQPVVLVGAWTRQHGTSKVYSVAGGSTTGRAGPLTIAPPSTTGRTSTRRRSFVTATTARWCGAGRPRREITPGASRTAGPGASPCRGSSARAPVTGSRWHPYLPLPCSATASP